MTDEIDTLAWHYVTSFGDGAEARIADDIAWAKSTLEWNEAQRLQRARYCILAARQRARTARQKARDFADRQARFVPGFPIRSLNPETRPTRLIAA